MATRTFNVGLLGTGYIAEWHAKALAAVEGVRLSAVCDVAKSRADDFAAAWGVPRSFGSLNDMLAAGALDAIHVLTPPDRHIDAALAIVGAGVAVLVEKPMGASAAECSTLVEAAAARNVVAGVSHNFLFSDPYDRLRNDVRSGMLGKVDRVEIDWSKELPQLTYGPFEGWMLRRPENLLLEIGAHSFGQLLDLLGRPGDDAVRALASNPIALPTGATAYKRWQVDATVGSAAATLHFSFAPGFAHHLITVRGSLGVATVDFERNTYVLQRHTPSDMDIDRWRVTRGAGKALLHQANQNLRDFALSKFKLGRRGNAFGSSIASGMRAFYAAVGGQPLDGRLAASFGRDVIDVCERSAALAVASAVKAVAAASPAAHFESVRPTDVSVPADVLVLGATGFIGTELVRRLTAAGKRVKVLVRSPSKLPAEIRGVVEVVRGDLSNDADLVKALQGTRIVYHLARANVKTWSQYQSHEIDVTRRIGEACLTACVRRLIYTGTIDSFYAGAKAGTITDDTPLDPAIDRRNLYARAKAKSEELLIKMHRERTLPLVIVRPGIVIGPGGNPLHWGVGMWQHNAVCRVWGDGRHTLPFVLVSDVADALVAAADVPDIEGSSFNLVGDPVLTGSEYLDEIEKLARVSLTREPTPIARFYATDMAKWAVKTLVRHPERRLPSYRDWESRTQRARWDCSKAKRLLNWRPTTSREEFVRVGIAVPVQQFLG